MSIHAKIQKLLNLAERAGTEAEAIAAMNAAHALLAKHNLTISDVEAHDAEQLEEVVTDSSTPPEMRRLAWKELMIGAVAELYFCKAYAHRIRVGRASYEYTLRLVGRPGNIAVVKYISAYLTRTCDELAKSESQAAAKRLAADGIELNVRAWAGSFRLGFAARIRERANEQIAAAKAGAVKDAETGKALVLAPLYDRERQAVADHMAGVNLRKPRGGPSVRSASGFRAGHAAAGQVNLASNGVAGKSSAKQIGRSA